MAKKVLSERIFDLIKELGWGNAEKCEYVYKHFGKYHVVLLNREQGLKLEEMLQDELSTSVSK